MPTRGLVVGGFVCALGASVALSTTATATPPKQATHLQVAAIDAAVRAAAPVKRKVVIGKSVQGRKIVAKLYGNPKASRVAVFVGSMHGDERAGQRIIKRLTQVGAPKSTAMWLITSLNPDGDVANTRRNSHKVDLNRNSPHRWKGTGLPWYNNPGPRAMSEPETRAYVSFLASVKPDVVLVYHQAGNAIDSYQAKSMALVRGIAKRSKLPIKDFPCTGVCTGTLTGWFNSTQQGVALTVELPRPVSNALVERSATAARWAATSVRDVNR